MRQDRFLLRTTLQVFFCLHTECGEKTTNRQVAGSNPGRGGEGAV